jgi:putative ABC transport system permease protein
MGEGPMWRRYVRFWGPDPAADIADELRFHMETKVAELRSQGVAEREARRRAAEAFGDRSRIEAELLALSRRRERRRRRAGWLHDLRLDVRQSARLFARRPGIPLLVVATLALAIGAGTAVFSLFDAVVLNPLAVERPAELVAVQSGGGESYPMSRVLAEGAWGSGRVAAHFALSVGLRAGGHAEQATASLVSGNYFGVLGVVPQHGRLLGESDEAAPGESPHVVLSDALWRRLFGADPGVVGRTVLVNDEALTVVGVAPPRFRGLSLAQPVDLWLPVTMLARVGRGPIWGAPNALDTWSLGMLELVARLPAGAPVEPLLARLTAVHRATMETVELPESPFGPREPAAFTATPLTEAAAARSREDLLRLMRVLAAVVVIGLGIACVNVANLLLIRGSERRRELSVRAAMGADAPRLARQLLLESALLGAGAGVLGIGVAWLSMRALTAFSLPGGIALAELSLPLDLRVLGFTGAVSLLCALAFGTAPALAGARADVAASLKESAVGGAARRLPGAHPLVTVQVALTCVLLVSGFLFVRSLQQALSVELGFRTHGVATLAVGLQQHGYNTATAGVFIAELLEQLGADPRVAAAAAASHAPLEGSAFRMPITAVDAPADAPRPRLPLVSATPEYLDVVGLRLLRGRGFDVADRAGAPPVALVTESAARTLWPTGDAIGRQFVPPFGAPITVVGVLADAHLTSLTEREPHIFLPLAQAMNFGALQRLRIVARGSHSNHALAALRSGVGTIDARLPVFHERDLNQHLSTVLMTQRFGAMLLGAFAGLALFLSAMGVYAVATYEVTRRRRELGIRAALGASARALVTPVLRGSAASVAAGLVLGLAAAAAATRTLRHLLFGIEPGEPVSYAAGALLLAGIAALAAWLPLRRAARVDPLHVIRE